MTESTPKPSRIAVLFKTRREELDLTQEEVASRVNALLSPPKRLTQQVYAAFEKGKSQTTKHAITIAQVLDIPLDALDENFTTSRLKTGASADARIIAGPTELWDEESPLHDEVEVPLLKEIELNDGSGHTTVRAQGTFRLGVTKKSLEEMGIQIEDVVCIEVSGNSMEPVIPDGGKAGVDRGRTTIKDGDMFAVLHNGQIRVKMLYRMARGGLRMRSFNREEHPDEEYPADQVREEQIEILGRIFWYSVLR
ncbi:helix-turn-helix domain-containing protein [Pseudomonas sp. AO-1]|jgi:phage repressor protein C with HTH and peptisase S24 domain|uniref:S24 family peptidase n=1 Tax=Pseudomonas sp. AO-1 TaxID=2855434 RepID=UPI001C783E08|nr:S24 family peptidase [Pseudomonas sp. AO-1]QXZ11746.1 helix-turn-helix domain-containing protein [Pseudomonas sp. AO-1]